MYMKSECTFYRTLNLRKGIPLLKTESNKSKTHQLEGMFRLTVGAVINFNINCLMFLYSNTAGNINQLILNDFSTWTKHYFIKNSLYYSFLVRFFFRPPLNSIFIYTCKNLLFLIFACSFPSHIFGQLRQRKCML